MPTTYASPDDVDRERTDDDPQWSDEKVQNLLEDAEDLVKLSRDLPARIAAGRTTAGLVRRVVVQLVLGVLRNPQGLRSIAGTETAGPYALTASRSFGDAASGELRLTREQKRMLGDKLGGIRTVAPGHGHPPMPWGC